MLRYFRAMSPLGVIESNESLPLRSVLITHTVYPPACVVDLTCPGGPPSEGHLTVCLLAYILLRGLDHGDKQEPGREEYRHATRAIGQPN